MMYGSIFTVHTHTDGTDDYVRDYVRFLRPVLQDQHVYVSDNGESFMSNISFLATHIIFEAIFMILFLRTDGILVHT
jgi:hypothetical protein